MMNNRIFIPVSGEAFGLTCEVNCCVVPNPMVNCWGREAVRSTKGWTAEESSPKGTLPTGKPKQQTRNLWHILFLDLKEST